MVLGRIAVVVVIIVVVIYAGLLVRWPAERPFSYWQLGAQTLQVVLLDSPNLNCDIAEVDESPEAVRIQAQCGERVLPVPQTGMAEKYVLQVTLQAPLGGRLVYDGSGSLAGRCQAPGPECIVRG